MVPAMITRLLLGLDVGSSEETRRLGMSLDFPLRDAAGDDMPVRLPWDRDKSSASKSDVGCVSPHSTNRGSSLGEALSSARSDIRMVVSPAESGNSRSRSGRPRYVCRTSNTSVE